MSHKAVTYHFQNIKVYLGQYDSRHKEIVAMYAFAATDCGLEILDANTVLCCDNTLFIRAVRKKVFENSSKGVLR
jgi:hypothetical protein